MADINTKWVLGKQDDSCIEACEQYGTTVGDTTYECDTSRWGIYNREDFNEKMNEAIDPETLNIISYNEQRGNGTELACSTTPSSNGGHMFPGIRRSGQCNFTNRASWAKCGEKWSEISTGRCRDEDGQEVLAPYSFAGMIERGQCLEIASTSVTEDRLACQAIGTTPDATPPSPPSDLNNATKCEQVMTVADPSKRACIYIPTQSARHRRKHTCLNPDSEEWTDDWLLERCVVRDPDTNECTMPSTNINRANPNNTFLPSVSDHRRLCKCVNSPSWCSDKCYKGHTPITSGTDEVCNTINNAQECNRSYITLGGNNHESSEYAKLCKWDNDTGRS